MFCQYQMLGKLVLMSHMIVQQVVFLELPAPFGEGQENRGTPNPAGSSASRIFIEEPDISKM